MTGKAGSSPLGIGTGGQPQAWPVASRSSTRDVAVPDIDRVFQTRFKLTAMPMTGLISARVHSARHRWCWEAVRAGGVEENQSSARFLESVTDIITESGQSRRRFNSYETEALMRIFIGESTGGKLGMGV